MQLVWIKTIRFFVFSAGALLLITGIAKLVSVGGTGRILQIADPIFSVSFRAIFWIVGIVELIIAIVCFFGGRFILLRAGLIAWLATSYLTYRLALWWIGWYLPCPCMGNLTDALHIPPRIADTAMKIILAYLLIGSYASLFWLYRQNKKTVSA